MKGNDLICIATPKWFGDYLKSTVQLMEQMAGSHNVLYVDYPYTWKDLVKGIMGKQHIPVRQILGLGARMQRVGLGDGKSIRILRLPPMIPVNWIKNPGAHDFFARLNSLAAARCIRKAAKRLGMEAPVVVNAFQPMLGRWMKGAFNEKRLIYYCYDHISAAKWLSRHGKRLEKQFMEMADLVIVTSAGLAKRKSRQGKPLCVLPNGVDFSLFSRDLPPRPASERKVIGYLGTIDDRMDLGLLRQLAEAFSHADFRFVGRCLSPEIRQSLSCFPNVQFIGPQEKEMLPVHLEQMDACIIPFEKNEFTRAIYPLKINEYLSRGKPVVTTRFADLSDFHGIIYTADSNADFGRILHEALEEDDAKLRNARIRFARANSWEARASRFAELIASPV